MAYLTPETVSVATCLRDLAKNVPEYMVPDAVTLMAELPLLPNGKVDRRNLPPPDFSGAAQQHYVAPRSHTEAIVQEVWHEVRLLCYLDPDS